GAPTAGQSDVFVAHYTIAGVRDWIRQIGTTALDNVYTAAPDGSGGVYVGGFTNGLLGTTQFGSRDGFIIHYTGDGTLLWVRQFGTSASEEVWGLAPDGAGGVLATGY